MARTDRAGQALAQGVPHGVPKSYRALADHSGVPRSTLHSRAQGRPSLWQKAEGQQYLTPAEDLAVVNFLLHLSDTGFPVRMKYIPDIAFCATRQRREEDWPPKAPGKNWAKAFERRHPELIARRVRAMDWNRHERNIYEKTVHWFEVIEKVLKDPEILPENVYNYDETGVMLAMLNAVKVLIGIKDKRKYRGTPTKRTMVTAIECIAANGSLEWLKRSFDPQTRERANSRPRVLICDGFGSYETLEILEFCFANNIKLCRLPSHTSYKLQPCDVAVFAPLKNAYREQVECIERGGTNAVGKEHFTTLYGPARERAFSRKNILAGFAACGLYPFNPERVLRDLPMPSADPTSTAVVEIVETVPRPQDVLPNTPTTPVSSEAFEALQNRIMNHTEALDETSQQSLRRYLKKMVKGGQALCASGVLLQNQIRFLATINNEAKKRRSTKSIILGKARVMSYEDLEEARTKRAEQERTQASQVKGGRRGRKRKITALEVDSPEPQAKLFRANNEEVQVDATLDMEKVVEPPFRAPVARMR